MPIIAIEGPDCCGKTSLLKELKKMLPHLKYVSGLPLPMQLVPLMPYVEQRQEALWRQLYDPFIVYAMDRSFCVTAEVYSKLYKRPLLFDPAPWRREHVVVYLDVPSDVLRLRRERRGDLFEPQLYERCRELYSEVLTEYITISVDGMLPTSELAEMTCSGLMVLGGVISTLMNPQSSKPAGHSKPFGTS